MIDLQTTEAGSTGAAGRSMNCAQSTMDLLAGYGTEIIFGIPGVHTLEFFRGFDRCGMRLITPRHEQGAAFMADGYARVTGRPGVCVLITGPGLTNAATPIAQAYADSIPMLIVSSVVESRDVDRGRSVLHNLPSQRGLMEQITAFSVTVREPGEIEEALARAFVLFASSRPRPVHIEIPIDVALQPGPASPRTVNMPSRPCAAPAALDQAAGIIATARAPVLVLGGGANDAGDNAAQLAEAIGAPIVTTTSAKGVVNERHPLSLGATLPLDGTRELIRQSDLLVAAGTELSAVEQLYTGQDLVLPATVVRIDIDPAQLAAPPTTHPVFGDAAPTLSTLARQMTGPPAPDAATRVAQARSAASQARKQEPFARLLTLLEGLLSPQAIVALDSTQAAYPATHLMTIGSGRSWLAPYTFGTLGCALPMALGAKAAQPDRPVVVLAGDGGLLFTMQEMATAVAENLPVLAIVWDNSAYGEIRRGMQAAEITPIGVEIAGTDLLQIAAGFGWNTVAVNCPERAETPIVDALAASHPTLIRLDAKGSWT